MKGNIIGAGKQKFFVGDMVGVKFGVAKNKIGKVIRVDEQLSMDDLGVKFIYTVETHIGYVVIAKPNWLRLYSRDGVFL